ncbi:hypothetical protein JJB99_09105 [Bradyrhizobium diazoefficiens]|uniref:hypothetical protein n=1 Tax=Bradyrhizobium diazoefficiens TaxID=1355477 RepID=UPI0019093AC1|nr:hypothetical protein [Bradyrhizobium diazoefficiens]QQO16281.1 hypothetical protein JJB99_09105 [Bradyrhizobium diazoefficiens]
MMEEFATPVELTDEELDLVAAGSGSCGCSGGDRNGNGSINVLSFDTVQVNVAGLAGIQSNSSDNA